MTTVPNFLDFTIRPNAVLCPTFIRKLYYKLSSILTFTFVQIFDQNFVFFTEWRQRCRVCLIQCQNSRYFWFPVLKTKSSLKSKPMWKLKHANSILETFEYFCQTSSKLILIIFSYIVSKLVRFFETQCKYSITYLRLDNYELGVLIAWEEMCLQESCEHHTVDLAECWKSSGQRLRMPDGHTCWANVVEPPGAVECWRSAERRSLYHAATWATGDV